LKRLGYTVQRTPQFIPDYFDPPRSNPNEGALEPFRPWWFSLPRWISRLISSISNKIANISYSIAKVGMDFSLRWTRQPFKGTLLSNWHGSDYGTSTTSHLHVLMAGSIFSHLRIIPTGHTQPLPPRPTPPTSENIYDALIDNPYLPFYHIWKPATPWSKAKWEKGTEEGLARQKPDYYAAIIEYVSFLNHLPLLHFSPSFSSPSLPSS
jgi:tRNA-splicing endonuclease subunit Sen54